MPINNQFWNINIVGCLTLGLALVTAIFFISELKATGKQNDKDITKLEQRVEKLEESSQVLANKVDVIATDVRWIKSYLEKSPKENGKK